MTEVTQALHLHVVIETGLAQFLLQVEREQTKVGAPSIENLGKGPLGGLCPLWVLAGGLQGINLPLPGLEPALFRYLLTIATDTN